MPPSTTKSKPVTYEDPSPSRYNAALFRSSGTPTLPIGGASLKIRCRSDRRAAMLMFMAVAIYLLRLVGILKETTLPGKGLSYPGEMVLTLIPSEASSCARLRANDRTKPLLPAYAVS